MHGQPRPTRYLSDLADKPRDLLERCHKHTVLVKDIHDEIRDRKLHPRTITTLVDRGLLEKGRSNKAHEVYKPSVAGLKLILADEPRLLAERSHRGYVLPGHELGHINGAMFGEPEAVDAATQQRFTDDAAGDQASRMSERSIAWEWERALQAAEAAGVDTTRQRLAIQKQIRAVQRKADQRAA